MRRGGPAPTDALRCYVAYSSGGSGLVTPTSAAAAAPRPTNSEVAKRALAYGAFDYVTKPIDITYLAQSIETAFTLGELTL